MHRKSFLAACFFVAAIASADAAAITKHVEFSISGNGPVSPVVGSFTITMDPTLNYSDATAGLVMDSLNLTVNSPVAFDYSKFSDILVIGGTATTNTGLAVGDYDFYFGINNFIAGQQFGGLAFVQGGPLNFYVPALGAVVNQLTVTDVQEVPEPLTTSFFSAGLIGAAALRRRKRPAAV